MRRAILLLIIFTGIISCEQKSNHAGSTTNDGKLHQVLALYDTGKATPALMTNVIYRIVKDTFRFVEVDANTQKKTFVTDTFYFIPVQHSKDSIVWQQIINRRVLRDGGECDSLIKKYKQ